MPIVHTKGLTRRFNGFVAVDSLDLDVQEKEVFELLGPNGAGKTTTIKMLTTLLPPSDGIAQVDGRDIKSKPAEVRKIIGYVPQMLSADASLTGFENLIIFAKLNDVPRDRVEARARNALERMGLSEFNLVLDFVIMGAFAIALILIAARLYPRVGW